MYVKNEVFGDACPETSKYLEFRFICVSPPATTTTTTTTPLPTTTTTSTSTTSSVKSSLTSLLPTFPPKFCQPKFEREVQFGKTETGRIAKAQCPINTYGEAEQFCSITGKWEGLPDLSNCVSIWIKKLDDDIQNSPEDPIIHFETMKDLFTHSRRHKLVGGELIKVSSIVEKVVYNYINIMKSSTKSKENHHQSREMNKFLVDLINNLLSPLQEPAWKDINSIKQRNVASKILDSSEKLLATIFSVTPTSESSMTEHFDALPNIRAI
uniref:G-protein coupled receptors family 2 profile 1 domain-containing protein n=1 Tax=Panagrolaimus davidi TaxID=227884 RepID=A0A914QN99_9BILA